MPGEGPGQAEVARRPGDARLCLGPSTQQTLEPAAAATGGEAAGRRNLCSGVKVQGAKLAFRAAGVGVGVWLGADTGYQPLGLPEQQKAWGRAASLLGDLGLALRIPDGPALPEIS